MPKKPKSNRPPVDLGNAPPEGAEEGSPAYIKWLGQKSDAPHHQPLGHYNHDDFIARQFAVDGKMTSTNTHEDAVKARRVKKNAKQAAHKVAKREEREQLKMLAASHAAVEKALQIQGDEHKVRKVKKQAVKRRATGPVAELSEPRVKKADLGEEEDAEFEWEDALAPASNVDNDDDLEAQLYAALSGVDSNEGEKAKAETDTARAGASKATTELARGGFAAEVHRGESEYDRLMRLYYS